MSGPKITTTPSWCAPTRPADGVLPWKRKPTPGACSSDWTLGARTAPTTVLIPYYHSYHNSRHPELEMKGCLEVKLAVGGPCLGCPSSTVVRHLGETFGHPVADASGKASSAGHGGGLLGTPGLGLKGLQPETRRVKIGQRQKK